LTKLRKVAAVPPNQRPHHLERIKGGNHDQWWKEAWKLHKGGNLRIFVRFFDEERVIEVLIRARNKKTYREADKK